MNKRNQLLLLVIVLLSFSFKVYSQSAPRVPKNTLCTIKGKVISSNQEPAQVVILNPQDSSLVKGDVFFSNSFEISNINLLTFIVCVSSINYKKVYFPIQRQASDTLINLPPISLTPLSLDEVVVTSSKQVIPFSMSKNKLIINVENSTLSDVGTASDILKKISRVNVDHDNNVSLIGKGKALILIDGRRLTSNDEISMLNSSDIEKIEVITNPSAEYDAAGKAIISITTKKGKQDGLYSKINLAIARGIFWRAQNSIDLSYKKQDWAVYTRYGFNPVKQFFIDKYKRAFDSSPSSNLANRVEKIRLAPTAHTLKLRLDHTINSKHTWGIQYNGWLRKGNDETQNTNKISTNSIPTTHLSTTMNTPFQYRNHSLSGNYLYYPDSTGKNLYTYVDYSDFEGLRTSTIEEQTKLTSTEKNIERQNYTFNHINIYSFNIGYKHIFKKMNLTSEMGVKLTGTETNSINELKTYYSENWITDISRSGNYIYQEKLSAAYLQLNKPIKKFTIDAGLRLENTDSRSFNVTLNQNILDTTYLSIFPSINFSYDIMKNWNMYLSYSKRITRPPYQNLNPFTFYIDSLSYFQGNASLIPEFTHSWETGITYKQYASINLSYTRTKYPLFLFVEQLEKNSDAISAYLRNFNRSDQLSMSINLPYETKRWMTFNTIGTNYIKNNFLTESMNHIYKKTMWYIYSYQEFRLNQNINIDISYQYNSQGIDGLFTYNTRHIVALGIGKSFWENKLKMRIQYSDIFNQDQTKTYSHVQNINLQYDSFYDARLIRFSLTINLGELYKPKSIGKENIKDELKRIQTD